MTEDVRQAGRIGLLGTVELIVPAGWSGGLPAQRRKVLALLAVNRGGPLSAEQLVRRLWDEPPTSATQMVRNQVNTLRRLITPPHGRVHTDPGGYRLGDRLIVDADRFRQLVGRARALRETGGPRAATVTLRHALALWRGPDALADVRDVADLELEARGLEELRFQAQEMLTEAYLAAGRPESAMPVLAEMTGRHPSRELPWVRLMIAQALLGRRAEASTTTYRRARHHLVEQTGLDAPLLDRTHLALLRGDDGERLVHLAANNPAAPRNGRAAADMWSV